MKARRGGTKPSGNAPQRHGTNAVKVRADARGENNPEGRKGRGRVKVQRMEGGRNRQERSGVCLCANGKDTTRGSLKLPGAKKTNHTACANRSAWERRSGGAWDEKYSHTHAPNERWKRCSGRRRMEGSQGDTPQGRRLTVHTFLSYFVFTIFRATPREARRRDKNPRRHCNSTYPLATAIYVFLQGARAAPPSQKDRHTHKHSRSFETLKNPLTQTVHTGGEGGELIDPRGRCGCAWERVSLNSGGWTREQEMVHLRCMCGYASVWRGRGDSAGAVITVSAHFDATCGTEATAGQTRGRVRRARWRASPTAAEKAER
eukprot:RCo022396